MKITPRPITATDEIDQSRDISGVNKWGRSSRTVGFVMFILGWFTIPVEVLLRRDFGQRWFTVVNFYTGLLLLFIFATLQYAIVAIGRWIQGLLTGLASAVNPFYSPTGQTFTDRIMDKSMMFFLLAYILMGTYHLFKIRWRARTNTALHSFDDGTSRIEGLAGHLMRLINALAAPVVWLYISLIPKRQRQGMPMPKLINDRAAFTNTVAEPLLLFVLAVWLHGMVSLWLYISAFALAIHANWRETAKLNKILDFRDSVMEAKVMMELKNNVEQPTPQNILIQQAAITMKDNPQLAPQMAEQYPDLMSIIEEMNQDRSHLAN